MHASHFTSTQIAEALGDGIIAPTVRAMLRRRWGLPSVPKGMIVEVPKNMRTKLEKQAAARGMTPEKYLARILFIAIRDDLFAAIVPPDER
jgi:HD-like signal output (HDOD) protein